MKKGFTLAEVLITLGIIGVVAAMTMSVLINKHNVSSWESGLKKSYSMITSGFHMIAAENGGDLRNSGLFDDIDGNTFSERIDKVIREHFNVVKTCKIGDTENCKGHTAKDLRGTYQGDTNFFNASSMFVVIFSDGSILSLNNMKCISPAYKDETKLQYYCSSLYLDINGEKGPNIKGKDVFNIGILNEKGDIYPQTSIEWAKATYGANNALNGEYYWKVDTRQCGIPNVKIKNDNQQILLGQNCLARIMESGWQMDYLK